MEPMKFVDEYISPERFETLVSHAKSERDRVLLRLIYGTGRRVSEVVRSLRAEDISQQTPNIYFNILKKKVPSKVWIRVSLPVIEMMREYTKGMAPNEYVFPICRSMVDRLIKEMGKKADMLQFGRRKIHVHMLRHSFAVNEARKCKNLMDAKMLQRKLQHSDINMTFYYLDHFIDEENEMSE